MLVSDNTIHIPLIKQARNYILKVWCTCVGVSPVLFTLLMINTIKANQRPLPEAFFVIVISIGLGIFYFLPSLLLSLAINRFVVKPDSKPLTTKMINSVCLLSLASLQLIYLYKKNLSLVYHGTSTMVFSYIAILVIASLFYSRPVSASVPEQV
jgi:hypothetical protein